jgi:hypothetical protein
VYILDHIYKTGGTTFNFSYLLAAFDPDRVLIVRGFLAENTEDLQRLAVLPEDEKRRWTIIAGHNTGRLRPHFPDAKFLTLLRDPVERAVSGYLHALYHHDAWDVIGREITESSMSLAHFVQTDFFAQRHAEFFSLHDWQAKVLLGAKLADLDLNDAEALTEAIASRFYLAGYTEALELVLFVLHVTDGFPLVLFNNRLVRAEHRTFQPSPADLAEIERHNQRDWAVYRAVRELFDWRVATIWNDARAALWREYNDALESFRRESGGDPNQARIFRTADASR